MGFDQIIDKRRSIRSYKEGIIDKELLIKIITDGIKAPSAHNRQPWKFIVLNDELKEKIATITNNTIINQAGVIILVYSNEATDSLMDMISVGACIENMLLSATSLNLGSLWIGSITNFEEEISSLLNINNLHLISAIALGYKNEEPSPRPRKLLDEVLEWR